MNLSDAAKQEIYSVLDLILGQKHCLSKLRVSFELVRKNNKWNLDPWPVKMNNKNLSIKDVGNQVPAREGRERVQK